MLSDYPELLAENVNSWFQREPTQRMVRTLDGTVPVSYTHLDVYKRQASLVYGATPQTRGKFLYVCDRWPACNAYVSAHERTLLRCV